jgi:signal transduction histidine kinase
VDDNDTSGSTALARRGPDQEADGLRRLAEIVAGTADLASALREVNRMVAPLGVKVASCALVSAQLRAATGAPAPDEAQAAAVDRWRAARRHGTALEPITEPPVTDAVTEPVTGAVTRPHGSAYIPVVHRRRVHGALKVVATAAHDPADAEAAATRDRLLPAIGMACGEVAWKAGARRELARSRRRLAIAVEQERTARDVQASVHRRLAMLGDRLAAHLAEAPDRVWRERMQELLMLTGEVDRDVRQSLNLLRTLPAQSGDLPTSLRSIAREVTAQTGMFVKTFVDGEPRRVTAAKAEAVFHVAVEALLAAAMTARAVNAVMVLEYRRGELQLVVRDDGVGPTQRNLFATAASPGIRGLQDRLARVGGRLRLSALSPRGMAVEAIVPTRRP